MSQYPVTAVYCIGCKFYTWIKDTEKFVIRDPITRQYTEVIRCSKCSRPMRVHKRKEGYCQMCSEKLPSNRTKYCDEKCRLLALQKPVNGICPNCKKEFHYTKFIGAPKVYCSTECSQQTSALKHRNIYRASKGLPLLSKEGLVKKTVACTHCGKQFIPIRKRLIGPRYCSDNCQKIHRSTVAIIRRQKLRQMKPTYYQASNGIPRPIGPVQPGTGNRSEEGNREQTRPA